MIRDSSLVSGQYEIHRKDLIQRTLINCEAQYVLGEKYMERGTRYEHLVRIGEEGIDNFHRDRSTLWK